jgi:diguanylate cyclase (GGDEF)-like protein
MERSRRRAWTARLTTPFIPQAVRDARPEVVFRARVLVAVLIFNGLMFAFTRTLGALTGYAWPMDHAALNWLLIGTTIAVHLFCLSLFRRTGSFLLAGNVFVGWVYLLVTAVAVEASGPAVDRVLRWMLLVPLYGFLALGLRGGIAWTVAALATSGLLHGLELPFLSDVHLRVWWDWSMLAVAVVIGLVVYENVVQRLLGLLETERRRFADAALHDPLTGLANRHAFDQALHRGLDRARRAGAGLALVYLDLDGFKPVNDAHGHAAGDEVLRVVARRLESAFREGDLVARVGGDEFAVIVRPEGTPPPLAARLEGARALLATPVVWAGRDLRVTASIGMAVYPDAASTAEALLARADEAMYKAKRTGDRVAIAYGPGA